MRRSKWLGFVATAFCALILGVGTGAATQSDNGHRHADGARQSGKVENGTYQEARSKAETEQKNYNVPFSFFEVGSNNGKVDQHNKANTTSKSENSNKTWQDLQQSQRVKNEGHRDDCGCHDRGWGDGNGNNWGKGFEPRGGDCGCDNGRGDKGHSSDGASQYGRVSNYTDQDAKSKAETEQKNYNVPIGLFQVGSNNGKVGQHNDGNTESSSSNWNKTSQGLKQDQDVKNQGHGRKGHDCGCERGKGSDKGHGNDGAKQDGKVDNWTDQEAKSKAETEQTNVNVPIAIFSFGSNNGDVKQGNKANTQSKSENGNETYQKADQRQQASGKDCGCADGASQKGSVSNGTDQDAKSKAETKQVNVNAPISIFSVGSNNGDVHQGNDANTSSSSSNWNGTGQSASQSQDT
jgi:hypothetical protein